eukprot:CAMPEP_0194367036 /NCGR_PEP_ID=MMETSP0174-20130528/15154_1 /TAXON_ID=216777 /ORGANISM="Proboscia alata, Strain PI-D3" /LENGTH=287 /DNA_ID=CAMNT_0039142597 /DNA_START=319 /DNA_END=1179 /DNA_ORIENTATION=-
MKKGATRFGRIVIALKTLDWLVIPYRSMPHGSLGVICLTSGAILVVCSILGYAEAAASWQGSILLYTYFGSTLCNAVAGFLMADRAPMKDRLVFRVTAMFQMCLSYYVFRFIPSDALYSEGTHTSTLLAVIDKIVAALLTFGILSMPVGAVFSTVSPAIIVGVTVGSASMALLSVYPLQLAWGGQEWWNCVQTVYPLQAWGMVMYIYIPATWAFASILFGATLWLRKIINDVEFGLGAMALSLLMVLITVLSQEVHIPSVSTQRLYIPCDPGSDFNARFVPTGDSLW